MKNLDFNIHGFTCPDTRAEYIALLDEALALADDLNEQISCMGELARKAATTTE